ncbi:sodium-coupled monocarboxylate transporter 2-like isoform X2 [Planococcus citri]
MASATYVIRTLLILGVATLTPCIAIKTVIGVPYYASITVMTIAAIFCVFSGGFSSALMGDVIQGILMFTCCVVVIVKGSIENGPINIIKTAHDRDRLNFFNFDLDPTKRATTISALIGHLFISLSMYGCQQNYVQRYISMATEEKVKRVLLLSIPFNAVMMSLTWIVGMVIFATYADCDPKKLQLINDIDEIFPFYLEDKFSMIPGFLGVILGTLFNGSLSAVVSNLNSLATVLWEDFLANIQYFKQVSDVKAVRIIKILGALCGLIVMGVSFGIAKLNGIIEIFIIMTSATSGPLLGVFILAVFFPSVNWKGALAGMIAGCAVVTWVILGSLSLPRMADQYLPTSTAMCNNYTFSEAIMLHRANDTNELMSGITENFVVSTEESITQSHDISPEHALTYFYKVTYLYYSVIGTSITVIMGYLFSITTGFQAEEYLYKDHLVHPLVIKRRPYHGASLSMEVK